jgi:hypothetical protein
MTGEFKRGHNLANSSSTGGQLRRARRVGALFAVVTFLASASVTLGPASLASASTLGISRNTAESLFHSIDGSHTVFKDAIAVKGVPRVLGGDKHLFTVVEINGNPEVVDVQIVSILDTSSKSVLENQVIFDSLACRVFANLAAEKWCTSRILNTNSTGMVTATRSKSFEGLNMTVKTYRSKKGAGPPIVVINFQPL